MNEHIKKEELEIDFWELAHFLWKKIGWILFCMILGAGLAGVVTKFVITPKYEASSMIYILGKTKSIDEGINLQLSKQLTVDFSVLAKSRPVMEQVIHTLDLDISYEKLEKMVRMENPENSSILKLTVISENPKFAKKVANALANATADQVAKVMVTEKPSMVEKAVMPIEPISPS